jgi:caa(3)-type oxidase subunit IV
MAKKRETLTADLWVRPVLAWLALIGLLSITIGISYIPIGIANSIVALFIAATKAAIIGWVFMRLNQSLSLNWLAAAAGPLWIGVMFLLIGTDYAAR